MPRELPAWITPVTMTLSYLRFSISGKAMLAPMAVASMLEIIRQLEAGALDRDQAHALAEACSDSEDVQEGITAQREKRAPRFNNR